MTTFALKSCDFKTATSKVQFVKHLLSFGSVSPVGGSVADVSLLPVLSLLND